MRHLVFCVLVFSVASLAAAQDQVNTLKDVGLFLDMESASGPQISPDGSQIIYSRRFIDKMNDTWTSELWIMSVDGSRHRFLTRGSNPRWSPDGSRIAYLAEGEPGGSQLFVRWMDAEGATSQITRVAKTPSSFKWSPDGASIAFVMLVPQKETWSIDMPPPPQGASWTKAPRMISKTHYRQDRQGFIEEGYVHLFVVDADGGTPLQLTEGNWHVGARFSGLGFGAGIDWMPDGSEIVFDGMMEEEPELDGFRQSYIYAVNVANKEIRQLVTEKGNWSGPAVSPDGERIAFAGVPFMTQTYHVSDLFVVDADGSNMTNLSRSLDRDAGQLFWSPNNRGIYFTAGDRGSMNILMATLNGRISNVTEGTHMLSLTSAGPNMQAVGTMTSFHKPVDVVHIALNDGTITQLTDLNSDIMTGKALGDVEEIWYTSTDDAQIQGWIVKPPDFDASKTYPLILHIHGGPHAMYNVSFSFSYQNYAANGYVVLYTNPRGSTGYGTEFGNAINNGYPSVDHEDLMAGVDALMDRGYIDENELYITGCSGGGVLSSWAIGQTDRFAAAAVRCPVVNWISFAGTADIVQWGYHRFDGYFWEDPTRWLEHSPLMHVGKVKTPVLLMTGELDLRTPMAQTEEYFAALKVLGVPAVMLRFNEEYHGTGSKPTNFMRTQLYIMDWFEKYEKKGEKPVEME